MKVVILAGGLGTRISEYTKTIPKPMVKINGKPLILRIMNYFANAGHRDFYIALGYKGKILRDYFKNLKKDWNIHLINTGNKTMTGGRLKRLKKFINNETFLMTYGDGLSDVNLKKLIKFHKTKKKLVTLTAVRPPARFGHLKLKNGLVKYFKEKSRTDEGWINGGFFVINPKFFNYIKNDNTYLEREPLENLTKKKLLSAFQHRGFWQCMDTIRDKKNLEFFLKNKKLRKIFN
jgi:glucose-1-phosphate cytidylyltransferase